MKPFNLEEAKAGKPVVTRDGHDVAIITFNLGVRNFPIYCMVKRKDGTDRVFKTTFGDVLTALETEVKSIYVTECKICL